MRQTKTQKEYIKQLKKIDPNYRKQKFSLFHNSFTQSRFFYYGIRIILIFVVISLVSQIDNFIDLLLHSF